MGILETINDYVYVAGLFMVGSFSAFAFTSYCIVKKDCKILANKIREERETRKKENEETENTLRENSYENKYKLDNVKHIEDHPDLKDKYTFEATPDGVVIMNYNMKEKTFKYWADKNISFKYLQAVARCFVSTYNCKNYYVKCEEKDFFNNNCPCDEGDCRLPESKESVEKDDPVDRDYKKAEEDIKKLSENVTKENVTKVNDDDLFITTSDKKKINNEMENKIECNTYSHMGNLSDFYDPTINEKKEEQERTVKKLSFLDFKNKQKIL
jgi:hypothetical protein